MYIVYIVDKLIAIQLLSRAGEVIMQVYNKNQSETWRDCSGVDDGEGESDESGQKNASNFDEHLC